MKNKTYLGDSVYLTPGLYGELILTTENGDAASNRIVLEPEVIARLVAEIDRHSESQRPQRQRTHR